jgi:hypothetical protein
MRLRFMLPLALVPFAALAPFACATSNEGEPAAGAAGAPAGGTAGNGGAGTGATGAGGTGGEGGTIFEQDSGVINDAATEEPPISADAACAAASEEATIEKLPVDIIWVVDNSSSMQPAIDEVKKGLNTFAALIAAKNLDYKVIMLALRGKTLINIGGSNRYPVCIPAPLAGDNDCGNGPRFFQSSVDIRSTQPLEQFLGTLGQTAGYMKGEPRGGDPWLQELRPQASKTIVVVTDDNARLSASDFENFAGGKNPFNSLTLPPGILHPSWNNLFAGYVFSGIYGWGSNADPAEPCTYSDGTQPPSAGPTYTTLVNKTGGVRAKLCAGSAAWGPFFDAVAQAVDNTAKLSCELTIPTPPSGEIDPAQVNVALVSGPDQTLLPRVDGAAACGVDGGWYYDDPAMPKKVVLCKSSCDAAQALVGAGKTGGIQVLFGCKTVIK